MTKKKITISLLLLAILIGVGGWFVSQDLSAVQNTEDLVDNLRLAGVNAELGGEVSQPFFPVTGRRVLVEDGDIQIFQYPTSAAADVAAANISSDGYEIKSAGSVTHVDWVATPHFYQMNNIIVLYVGDNENVLNALGSLIGPQFAGGTNNPPDGVPSALGSNMTYLLDVPFTAQAPSAQWDDVVFQNACEEASILMAMRWVEGKPLTREEANKEIADIADFQKETYGHFHDRSARDTAQLIKEYYGYQGVGFQTDIGSEDVKEELQRGNVAIVPVNGQKLGNPFYTPPGPLEHMIVIVGYDAETNEFITHDPGTRRGENFRYAEDVLDSALREYGTGYHEPIAQTEKVMIVVRKSS